MDKVNVFSLEGQKKTLVEVPKIFDYKPRLDLIQMGIEVSQSKKVQTQGRNKRAGLRNTAESWGTGHGMARSPRIKGSGFPTARNVGRVPYAKGGRVAHPIKTEKNIVKKINNKAKQISLISAISASGNLEWIKERGHIIKSVPQFPLVVDDKIQTIKKTRSIYSILCELGLKRELLKVKDSKKVRAGKGKRRGRKYKSGKGPLIVIKEDFGIVKASRNLPGCDIIKIDDLAVEQLAPGALPGRIVIWTQSAFNELNKYDEWI
jgi:large subunit ribosomal protein L4e